MPNRHEKALIYGLSAAFILMSAYVGYLSREVSDLHLAVAVHEAIILKMSGYSRDSGSNPDRKMRAMIQH